MTHPSCDQLGFDALLVSAESDNAARIFARQTAHLPGTMPEGLAYHRVLIKQHHAAMLAADAGTVMALREEAHLLARKLNSGEPGILASDDAPGCVLERECAAPVGEVPCWGQAGEFIVSVGAMKVRIELHGMFGIGATCMYWPGFAATVVEPDRPFISSTGYYSFLGIHAERVPNMLPDEFAANVVEAHIRHHLKGKLETVAPRYRERYAA